MNIKPLTDFLGAEVRNLDISKTASKELEVQLSHLLDERQVLLFRDQDLTEEQYINFASIFANPVESIMPGHKLKSHPMISVHSNKTSDGKSLNKMTTPTSFWHSDSYFSQNRAKATFLYSKVSPSSGGETWFINMRQAYSNLPADMKSQLADKRAIYKNAFKNRPPVQHDIVLRNKHTGEKALYINRVRCLGITGMAEEAGVNLAQHLYNTTVENTSIYKHRWEDGDIVVWDNPSTMHTATPIDDSETRVLHRILTTLA